MDLKELFPYVGLKKHAEGKYGSVYKGKHAKTGCKVAVKLIQFADPEQGIPPSAIREILIFKELSHAHIIQLLDVITADRYVAIICEWGGQDLRNFMWNYSRKQWEKADKLFQKGKIIPITRGLHPKLTKRLFYEMLLAVYHCHRFHILHRDIKPDNILILKTQRVKLTDFSLARAIGFEKNPKYVATVGSRWYRAPELLLGASSYSTPVDIWSLGCVFAEMIWGVPLFQGSTNDEQIELIFRLLGTPSERKWPELKTFPGYSQVKALKPSKGVPLSQVLGNWSRRGISLLRKMLQLNPRKRITAAEALKHPYFKELFEPFTEGSRSDVSETSETSETSSETSETSPPGTPESSPPGTPETLTIRTLETPQTVETSDLFPVGSPSETQS